MKGLLFIFSALLLAFAKAQGLPECVYDAFPDLNQTLQVNNEILKQYPKGVACDLCVNLLTEIEHILEDQTIEDAVAHAVENLCLPIIWAFEPCYKLVEACLPDLIQAFVDELVPPRDFCELLFICPETK